ncbi:amino acid permease [Malacoplasma iowae]|uniref:Amino acid transporter n=1 Tax=Malacoplasma iowae DK-CPA TaxID=1394179 RepID=A0A084U3F3_MALIO|nr:amino acid permease [Malacoplasma iowae]KFB07489.1 amino acid transporter [Malacoplasma iowae DK-CPA]WPL37149.1 amino acid permease [Malacoplasma iowae]WPL37732.1 amino acid permease [Malacoplasma iowae]WPL40706.1 amino acid permease [Malacoplasma iowae]
MRKTFSLKKTSSVDKKISLFAMVSVALLAIFNFQNVVDNYVGLGLSAAVAFLIAVVVFLFPFVFIIAEFASLQKGTKSGLTSWIQVSVGRKVAFLTSFMFWFANLTYFFSAVPSRINYLSFAVTGSDYTNDPVYNQVLPWVAVAFFFLVTFISTLNTKKLSKVTSLGGGLMIGITAFFFVVAIIGWIVGSVNSGALRPSISGTEGSSTVPGTEAPGIAADADLNLWGTTGGLGFAWISTFIWVLMAADGGQSLGVYVNEVRGGRKTFIRAMLISVSLIGFAYVLGTLLVSVFPPTGGLASGWADSFSNLFYFILHPMGVDNATIAKITYILIGSIFFISAIGGIIVWTSAPVKVMFSEISPGVFGQRLSKENRHGVCSFGTWIQFIIVTPLMLFLMLSKGDLASSLELIKGAAGWIGLLPWLVIFASYVNLRMKKEYEIRSFKMGNRIFGISLGIVLSIITIGILFLTFFDRAPLNEPYETWPSDWYLGSILKVVMIFLILVPAYLWYYFKFEYQIRDAKIANRNNISQNAIINKYNFISKLKYRFIYNEKYQEFEYKKNEILDLAKEKITKIYEQEDKLQEMINVELDKTKSKELKISKKELKKEISNIKKELKSELRKATHVFNNEILSCAKNDKLAWDKDYVEIKKHINELKKQEELNKKDNVLIQQIITKKKQLKEQINNLKIEYKNKNIKKDEFNSKNNELLKELYTISIVKPYKDIMIEDLESSIKKDIDFDDVCPKKYFEEMDQNVKFETIAAYDYGFYAKKELSSKIIISDDKFLLVQTLSGSLVAKQYELKNIKLLLKSKDQSITITNNGKWIDLDKIELIHVENSQIESFVFYIQNSKELISYFNK